MIRIHDPALARLWSCLRPGPAWLTGGYIRDRILGRSTRDVDLVMPGDLDSLEEAARRVGTLLGSRPHALGKAPRAVWRIESAELKVEIWPLAGLSLASDARRRDLTCNALHWRLPAGPLIDTVGGLHDIAARRLRAVSRENLEHDPVRLLRVVRLAAQLPGFRIERRTARWVAALAPAASRAPRDRIGRELLALLAAPAPARGMRLLDELALAPHVAPQSATAATLPSAVLLPAFTALASPRRHPVPGALAAAGDGARLALLFASWGSPDAASLAAFGWPRGQRIDGRRAAAMLGRAVPAALSGPGRRRLLIHEAGSSFPALLAAAAAAGCAAGIPAAPWRRWWRQWRRCGRAIIEPALEISVAEIEAVLGPLSGPRLGAVIGALKRARAERRVRSRSGALRFLRHLSRTV